MLRWEKHGLLAKRVTVNEELVTWHTWEQKGKLALCSKREGLFITLLTIFTYFQVKFYWDKLAEESVTYMNTRLRVVSYVNILDKIVVVDACYCCLPEELKTGHYLSITIARCTRKASVSWKDRDFPSLLHGFMWTTSKGSGVHLMTFWRERTPASRHRCSRKFSWSNWFSIFY